MDEPYPNGESPLIFFNRIKKTYHNLLNDNSNNNLAIVTHAGVINIIYHLVKDIEWSNKNKPFSIKNASIHLLEKNEENSCLIDELATLF